MSACSIWPRVSSTNKTLKRLDVRYNGGGPRCAAVFASHLRKNSSLTELVLDGNPLGAEGLRAFSRAAGEITSSLKLRDCLYDVKKPFDQCRPLHGGGQDRQGQEGHNHTC